MSKKDLKVTLIGEDKTGGAFNSAGGNASKMVGVLAAAAAAAAAAVGVFVVKGVKDAVELDTKLREINTLFGLTGKAGEKNFADISRVVKEVSGNVGVAQKTIAEGLYNAISAGVPKENAFTFMQVASKAAIAGVTDVNTAVNGMTTVINAFGLQAADAAKVADSMFTAVKGGKTTFRELSDALFNVAPAAAASKVSFQEVNAAIATLTASGTPTSVATTQIRAALTGLQKPSKDLDAIFQKLGYTNAQTAIESKGLGFALDAVKVASGGNNGQLQKLLGSTEAVAAANVLAGTGAAKFRAELDAQAGSAGATDKAFAEMEQSVGRQWERLKVQVQNFGIEVGSRLLPLITSGIDKIGATFDKVAPVVQKVTDFVRENQAVVGSAAVTIGTLYTIVKAVTIAKAVWTTATGAMTAAQLALNAAMRANPIGIVITVVAALVAGLVFAYKNSETFRDVVNGAFEAVKVSVGNAVGLMIQGFRGLLTVWLTVADGIISGAAKALGWIPGLGGKLQAANAAFDTMKAGILRTLDDAANKAYGFGEKSGGNAAKGLAATTPQAVQAAVGMASAVGTNLRAVEGVGYSAGANAGQGLANGLASKASAVAAQAQRLAIIAGRAMASGLQERSPSRVTMRIGDYAAEGLIVGMDKRRRDVARTASDLVDLAGMRAGGAGYINGRLSSTASAAPVEPAAADRTGELIALLIEQNELLRRMPRDYMLAQRQG